MNDVPMDALAGVRAFARGQGSEEAWQRLRELAQEMESSGRRRDDPIRSTFALLGDRWTMLILLTLGAGAWRHATLRRILAALSFEGAISQRVLTLKLRTFERDGFVTRHMSADVPPHVEYRLSPMGERLLAQASSVLEWVRLHKPAIDAARRDFDSREDGA